MKTGAISYIFILLTFIELLILESYGADLAVQPLYFEYENNGQTEEQFHIKVKTSSAAIIVATVYSAQQELTGKLNFINSKETSVIKLRKRKFQTKRAGLIDIRGTIKFPRKKNITKVYALMIEESKSDQKKGIGIHVRYAVVFKLNLGKKRVYERGKLESINFLKLKDKNILSTIIENQISKDFKVVSKAIIRNMKGKLITEIPLKSMSSWQKGADESIVFPMSRVQLIGDLKKIKSPGIYKVTVQAKINGKKQIIKKSKIVITKKDIETSKKTADGKLKTLSVKPENIEVKVKKGKVSHYRIELSNNSSDEIKVELPKTKKNKMINYSFFPSELTLRENQKKYAVLKIAKTKSKKDQIKSLRFNISRNGKIEHLEIPVSLIYSK